MLIYGELEKLAMIQQNEIFEQLRIKARLANAYLFISFISAAIAGGRIAETMTPLGRVRDGDREGAPHCLTRGEAGERLLRLGDTANAVVLAQVAAEIFLDALLALLLWEGGASPEDVAEKVFASDLTRRVRSFFPPRLGGDWNLKGTGPVGDWKRQLYELRGRVIHGGYEPSRTEAEQALTGRT